MSDKFRFNETLKHLKNYSVITFCQQNMLSENNAFAFKFTP